MNNIDRLISQQRLKEIARGIAPLIGEKELVALTAMYWHQEHQTAVEAFQEAGRDLLLAQEQIVDLIAQLEAAQKEIHGLKMKLSDAGCLLVEWKQRVEQSDRRASVAEAALSAANEKLKGERVPDGFVMVPAKASIAMIRSGGEAAREYMEEYDGNSPQVIYQAMLAAAMLPAGFTVEGE
ncbi:hypothetical protein [Yersinia bercovieri]|uniref:hypothetical protein n=1 Tax=Yersinia bercovieri TaxID=634 RepID=UPI001CFDE70D|nr:hypothetical protein [Yersinia bercovieri]MCB5301195.1 hypothetical protein [Yersinia bercovieri]